MLNSLDKDIYLREKKAKNFINPLSAFVQYIVHENLAIFIVPDPQ